MGTVKLGNEYLLWIPDATDPTPVHHALAGQGTATINRNQAKIDTSSKDTKGYATSAYGLKELTVDLDVKVTLPDANGWTRLETLANAEIQTPFVIQIRKNGSTGVASDSVFTCLVNATIQSVAFNQNGTVDAKIQFGAAAAPTVDVLA